MKPRLVKDSLTSTLTSNESQQTKSPITVKTPSLTRKDLQPKTSITKKIEIISPSKDVQPRTTKCADIPTANQAETDKSSETTPTQEYGCGEYKPKWMQMFNNPKCLLFCLSYSAICQGMICNGLVPISLTTLERRFHLRSSESGFFASGYDIAVTVMLLPVSHFGGKGNKPKWLGIGVFIMGIGSIVCSLPQFLVGPVPHIQSQFDVCTNSTNLIDHNSCDELNLSTESVSYLRSLFLVLLLGQFICGFGASPLYTLGVTFLDENVAQISSSVYLGFFYGLSVLGPAIGFVLGGALLRVDGDLDKAKNHTLTIAPDDPLWYGAWWMGFIIAGTVTMLISVPVIGFAPRLPGARAVRKEDVDQGHGVKPPKMSKKLSDFPKEVLHLVKNYPYICVMMMKSFEALLMSAFINFVPKMLENFFNYSSSASSLIAGAILIPGGIAGNIVGGFIIRRWKLRCSAMIMMSFITQVVSLVFMFGFMMVCPKPKFVGINETSIFGFNPGNVTDGCNDKCQCSNYYNPVCHKSDHVNFYSPCHAGCRSLADDFEVDATTKLKQWTECECVNATMDEINLNVTGGYCTDDCKMEYPFLILLVFQVFVTFIAAMPVQQVELRTVTFHQRTLAVSFSWFFMRLLGSIPGPILLGFVIDNACVLWKIECGKVTSCLRYDPWKMSTSILLIGVIAKLIICLFLLMAWCLYNPRPDDKEKIAISKNLQETSIIVKPSK